MTEFQAKDEPMAGARCRLCGSPNVQPAGTAVDRYVTEEEFQLFACHDCHVVFTDYEFDEAGYSHYYPETYYAHTEAHMREGRRERVQRTSLRLKRGDQVAFADKWEARILGRMVLVDLPYVRGGRLLDVGCGAGKLLRVAQSVGFECFGAEPSSEARKILVEHSIRAYDSLSAVDTPDAFFDVVLFNQSLEHISDPMAALRRAVSLLKPSGILIVSVPNYQCNERRTFGDRWRHVDVPRHLFHFSPATMAFLARRLGLETVGRRFKFWGGPGAAIGCARKQVGLAAYWGVARYALRQAVDLLTRDAGGYGQMMTYTFVKSPSRAERQNVADAEASAGYTNE